MKPLLPFLHGEGQETVVLLGTFIVLAAKEEGVEPALNKQYFLP
jgi:hypothetical protein